MGMACKGTTVFGLCIQDTFRMASGAPSGGFSRQAAPRAWLPVLMRDECAPNGAYFIVSVSPTYLATMPPTSCRRGPEHLAMATCEAGLRMEALIASFKVMMAMASLEFVCRLQANFLCRKAAVHCDTLNAHSRNNVHAPRSVVPLLALLLQPPCHLKEASLHICIACCCLVYIYNRERSLASVSVQRSAKLVELYELAQ